MNINVYDEIAANDRRTIFILLVFPIALFVTVYLIFFILAKTGVLQLARFLEPGYLLFGSNSPGIMNEALRLTMMFYPWMVLVALIWIVISYYKGDSMILGMANARTVSFEDNRELFRLVENTAIMAGVPTPQIFIIEDESLNAFATGRNPQKSTIALTQGLVNKLDKSELQAVIAHELAHISNRDTRLMLITVTGIGCFIFFGGFLLRMAFRSGRFGRSRGSGKSTLLILVVAIACFIFGYLVAPLLRYSLSRRREYQADATAVRITRDPEALVRALYKISVNPHVEVLKSSPLVGNMCIANPIKTGFIGKLYLTHPPIEDRIATLNKMLVRGKSL